jgi:hypothetical protein
MKHRMLVASILTVAMLSACEKSKPPAPQSSAAPGSHPVKNVESLPSGAIQEGARTVNKAADMGGTLDQQKQERDKEVESQSR